MKKVIIATALIIILGLFIFNDNFNVNKYCSHDLDSCWLEVDKI